MGGSVVAVSNWTGKALQLEKDQLVGMFAPLQETVALGVEGATAENGITPVVELIDLDHTDLTGAQKQLVRAFLAAILRLLGGTSSILVVQKP